MLVHVSNIIVAGSADKDDGKKFGEKDEAVVDDEFSFLQYKPCKTLKFEPLLSPDSIDGNIELSFLKSECAQVMNAVRHSLPTYVDTDFLYVMRDNTIEIWTLRAFKKFELVLGPTAGEIKDNSTVCILCMVIGKGGRCWGFGLAW